MESTAPAKGNARFRGFCMELLDLLSRELGFTFAVELVKDGKYGDSNDGGKWNGMIGELLRNVGFLV